MNNMEFLQKNILFAGSSKEELELALGLFQERKVKPKTVIFSEKMSAEAMYIIKSGSVRITAAIQGKEIGLMILGPGEFFGEMALLRDGTRLVNAKTEEPTDLLILTRKDFQALTDLDPRTGARITSAIARLLSLRISAYGAVLKEVLLQ